MKVIIIWLFLVSAIHAQIKIMPLGDSLTEGANDYNEAPGGYRTVLYDGLSQYYDVDFVGTLTSNPNPLLPDSNHEGHGGYKINQIYQTLHNYLTVYKPDIYTLMIGRNDISANLMDGIQNRLETLIDHIYYFTPNATIYLASIPTARVFNPNDLIYNDIVEQVALNKQCIFVDVYPLVSMDYIIDSVHPNLVGYNIIGQAFLDAMLNRCPGDANLDGQIDIFDINTISNHWGTNKADVNRDGTTDIFDINLVSNNWPQQTLQTVPEPPTWILGFFAMWGGYTSGSNKV